MIILLWVTAIVLTYMVGFIGVATWEERTCLYRSAGHKYDRSDGWGVDIKTCNHPWDDAVAAFWPVVAAMMLLIAPFWLIFGGCTKIAHKLAEIPTRDERRAVKAEQERALEIERDERHQQMAGRILELENELGVKHDVPSLHD